jgi:hypothetical protein
MKTVTLGILSALIILLSSPVLAQNVWTQHNDQGRTGWYPYETTLNTTNVNQNTFGINFIQTLDDQIVAQPLVVLNLNIPNKGFKNVVFVATLNNSVYAYDADENVPAYWQQNYTNKIAPSPAADCSNCRPVNFHDIHPSLCSNFGLYPDFVGNLGIIGTPVIDTAAGTMYFVTKIANETIGLVDNHPFIAGQFDEYTYTNTGFHQYLHAIDITTGIDRSNSPVEINPILNGTGDGQVPAGSGHIPFEPRRQFNRAGLVLNNGILYIAFAAHCDNVPSHGLILSYSASTLGVLHTFITTPNDGRGGTWMSGTAPAVDANGNIYFTTGNALNETVDGMEVHHYPTSLATDPLNRGESVIKLAPDLTLSDYFTPFNYLALNDDDLDFPIQMMILPNTNLVMTGCKDDSLYIFDRNNLGGFDPVKNNVKQTVFVPASPLDPNAGDREMHSTFAYFGGPTPYAYQYSESSLLMAYPVSVNGLGPAIVNNNFLGPNGGTGGFLSVSSNGPDPATGILWAYQPVNGCDGICHGTLHAVKASDITKELWNSDMNAVTDQINVYNKMSCPTITLGKVYMGANQNQLYVYGLESSPAPCPAPGGLYALPSSTVSNISIFTNQVPAPGNDGMGSPLEIGVKFRSSTSGYITGIRFYKTLANTGSHIGELYSYPGGASLAQATFTGETASGWQTVTFSSPVAILANTTYVAAYFSGSGNFTGSANYFGTPVMNGPLTALADGTDGANGVYIYNATPAFPTNSPGNQPNYWVDALFSAVVTQDPNSEILNWNTVVGAGQYIIRYRPSLSASWISRTSNSNSLVLTALSCGTIYYYTVQADCGATQSTISSGSFKTADCPANSCDPLPAGYYNVDLGDIGVAGSTCKTGNIYNLTGSGTDIGGNADQFQFAFTSIDIADYDVVGRVIQQDQVNPNDKIGVMVRDSLTNTSRFAYMASVNNGTQFIYEYRSVPSGPVTTIVSAGHTIPYWVRINKTGTTYTAYVSGNGSSWLQVGSPVNLNFGTDPTNAPHYGMAITSADNTILSTGQIDNFTITASNPLPVRLLSFSAKKINSDRVLVSWATSMEHLTDYFEIQRSTDNNSFQAIGKVKAVGESETPKYYSMNDNNPLAGLSYYRLKEMDKDGNFYFSPVVSVKIDQPEGLEIYPNPADHYTNINSFRYPILEVKVYDVAGKLVENIQSGNGQYMIRINTADLSKGVYIITVKTTNTVYRQKLFKE